MKYFLSHASSDDSFLRAFLPVLREIDPALDEGKDLFYSSNAYAVGVRPGQEVLSSLAKALEEADCVILFLTSDYLRKPFCLYEASLASYFRTKGKKLVVPIAASSSLVAPLEPLFPGLTYVNAEEKGAAERFFSAFDLKGKASPAADAFFSSFASKGTAFSLLPPLGMGKERYLSLFPYLEKSGIERCDDGTPSTLSSLRSTLEGAKDIYVFNSRSASIGETLIALKIEECEKAGMGFQEVVDTVEAYIEAQHTYFVLESLEALRKNGRLSNLKAFVANALNIKPVMGSTPQGTICQLDQARGMNRALKKMVDYIVGGLKDPGEKILAISHCNCPERAEMVKQMILSRVSVKDVIVLDTAGVSSLYASDGGVIVVV